VVAAVMLMDNGALAQNNYYYRNSMPVNRYRPMQSNSIHASTQYKPISNPWTANNNNQINSHVPRSNNINNNWGWQAAAVKPQQQRWKLDFDDSIEDDSIESSFYRRPSAVPRYQRQSIINSNPHTVTNNNNNRAWSRPSPVTARPVQQHQQIRWNNRFDDSVEDHSVESREFRRW
jgi:hypothetical protein